jgi:hypothetical protein
MTRYRKNNNNKAIEYFWTCFPNKFLMTSQANKKMSCFLPGGKAEDAPSPALPRTRSKILRLRPWTPWIWGILGFCNNRVNRHRDGDDDLIANNEQLTLYSIARFEIRSSAAF